MKLFIIAMALVSAQVWADDSQVANFLNKISGKYYFDKGAIGGTDGEFAGQEVDINGTTIKFNGMTGTIGLSGGKYGSHMAIRFPNPNTAQDPAPYIFCYIDINGPWDDDIHIKQITMIAAGGNYQCPPSALLVQRTSEQFMHSSEKNMQPLAPARSYNPQGDDHGGFQPIGAIK